MLRFGTSKVLGSRRRRIATITTAVLAGVLATGGALAYAVAAPRSAASASPSGPLDLYYSTAADRSGLVPLNKATVRGNIYASVDGTGVDSVAAVTFWLDDLRGAAVRTERQFPFELGSDSAGVANPFDTRGIADGPHVLAVQIDRADGTQTNLFARFAVANAGPAPSPTVGPTASPTASPTNPPGPGRCTGFPTPDCTGVPPGTQLRELAPNGSGNYEVTTAGTVLDGVHVRGGLLIRAENVAVRNSRIDGSIRNLRDRNGRPYPFTVADTTIGLPDRCSPGEAIREANFVATRVSVRGFHDAFRAEHDNVTVTDSYAMLCGNDSAHSDGIQTVCFDYRRPPDGMCRNLVLRNNTIDQSRVSPGGVTSPVFMLDAYDALVENNLLIGGCYQIRLAPRAEHGDFVVRNNALVGGRCTGVLNRNCERMKAWANNQLVRIDAGYRVTGVIREVPCTG